MEVSDKCDAPVPAVQVAGWVPGPVWTAVEKNKSLALSGYRTPNRPARNESPYPLCYPGRLL